LWSLCSEYDICFCKFDLLLDLQWWPAESRPK
jgi:hypothetical protein